jgi:hypothetical protein
MVKKLNIVLDIDETLINSVEMDTIKELKNKAKQKRFNSQKLEDEYVIFERPGLQLFLNYLFKHFNVSVWSAGTKSYVRFIVDKMIRKNNKKRSVKVVLCRDHCDLSEKKYKKLKNLALLWEELKLPGFSKENTVIIDDLKENCTDNRSIHVNCFEYEKRGSYNDNEFKRVRVELDKIKKDFETTLDKKGIDKKIIDKKSKPRKSKKTAKKMKFGCCDDVKEEEITKKTKKVEKVNTEKKGKKEKMIDKMIENEEDKKKMVKKTIDNKNKVEDIVDIKNKVDIKENWI